MKEKLAEFITKAGQQNVIFIAGLAGILLIAFAQLPSMKRAEQAELPLQAVAKEAGYDEKLEQRLEEILGSISGVGRVNVMVTLESGTGYEYAKENKALTDKYSDIKAETEQKTQEKSTTEESYVMLDGGSGAEKPLITKELSPQIKGVVVVCEGGGNPVTVNSVIETVKVAVNISSTQISVSKMGQGQ